MKNLIFIIPMFFSINAFGDEHNHLDSHVHGALKLEIAVEGNSLFFRIDGPAEAILGFEHSAKSASEKKTYSTAESLWKNDLLTKVFVMDKKLGCKVSEILFQQEVEKQKESHDKKHKSSGTHSDIEAQAKYTCVGNVKGQTLTVALRKHFPHIKKLTIDLVGSEVRSIDAKKVEEVKL